MPRVVNIISRDAAGIIRSRIRRYDMVGRVKGDIFLLLLSSCSTGVAVAIVWRKDGIKDDIYVLLKSGRNIFC